MIQPLYQRVKFFSALALIVLLTTGFASGERGNKISLDDELAKLSLIVETAAEVWGD